MNKFKHYAATATLLGLAALGLAACGDTPTSTPPPPPTFTPEPPTATPEPPTPTVEVMIPTATTASSSGAMSGPAADMLQKAEAAMKGLTSYHFAMNLETGGAVAVSANGDFEAPDKMRLNMDLGSMTGTAGTGMQEILIVGQDGYMKNPVGEGYINMGTSGASIAQNLNPQQFTGIASLAQGATVVGDETVDGVETTHIKLSYNADKAAGDAAKAAGQPTPAAGMGSTNADMWLDKTDNYIRKIQVVTDTSAVPGATQPATGLSTVTITYSNFNEAINPPIEKPADVSTMPGAEMMGTAVMPGETPTP